MLSKNKWESLLKNNYYFRFILGDKRLFVCKLRNCKAYRKKIIFIETNKCRNTLFTRNNRIFHSKTNIHIINYNHYLYNVEKNIERKIKKW